MTEGARHSMAIVAESTYGTTPATPTLTNVRHNSETLTLSRDSEPSGELGREVKNLVVGPRKGAGDIVAEISYGSHDLFWQALLSSTWAPRGSITSTTISAQASDNSFNDSGNGFITGGFQVGDEVTVTGFTGDTPSANNATFVITALTAGKMTIGGTDGDVIVDDAAGESVTITSAAERITRGETKQSFTVEKDRPDMSDYRYMRKTGVEIGGASFSVGGEAKSIPVTFNCMFKDETISNTAISGATYGAATTTVPMDGFTGTIEEGGSAIAIVTEASINITPNLAARYTVGAGSTIQHSRAKLISTGTITVYFETHTLYNKWLNRTDSSLKLSPADAAGNMYIYTFPNVEYTSHPIETTDDGPVLITMDWHAKYDTDEAASLMIDRVPA